MVETTIDNARLMTNVTLTTIERLGGEMSENMASVYQKINKRRQKDEMDVNALTMFGEAWNYQQSKIDELQKQLALVLDAYYLTDYFDANVCISAENALGDENRLSDSWYLKNVKGESNDN